MSFIELNNLTKIYKQRVRSNGALGVLKSLIFPQYNSIKAVNNINFKIERGESVAYIGINGSGKSTTIKLLSGILSPSKGNITINGREPYKERIRHVSEIGVVFGQRTPLYWDLPMGDSLLVLKEIYKLSQKEYQKNFDYLKETLNLKEIIDIPVRQMSLGQKMRATLTCALLHNPPLLLLDEPTIGLDVISKENLRKIIKRLNEESRTTLFLTTHDISDVEELCERIIMVHKGSIFFDGTITQLYDRYISNSVAVIDFAAPPVGLPEWITANYIVDEPLKKVLSFPDEELQKALAEILKLSNRIENITVKKITLKEIIKNIFHTLE